MPLYKYIANRFLTLVENLALGVKLSEFHTGYRAFSRRVLEILPLGKNSDNFVFDNEMRWPRQYTSDSRSGRSVAQQNIFGKPPRSIFQEA
jgi:hypothetical protein